jgi:hypothetical protein
MEKKFIKDNPGLFLTGIIFIWYIVSTVIDLVFLTDTKFSNLFHLKEPYLKMKPIEVPLPETGVLLFLLGTLLIIAIYLLTEKQIPKNQTVKYILSVFGFSFLIFILLIPILVIGEILYYILIDKVCKSVSWLNWLKDIADMFTFKAQVQASFIKNPLVIDISLGGFIALYIGIPKIRAKLNI